MADRSQEYGWDWRLVKECTLMARLWQNRTDSGVEQRVICIRKKGYQLIEQEPAQSFANNLVGQTRELTV